MNINDAKERLLEALSSPNARHWAFGPAIQILLNELATKEEQCATLAAENAAQKSVVAENWNMRDVLRQLIAGRPGGCYFIKWEPLIFKALNETPATDVFLAEARAQGVERAINCIKTMMDNTAPAHHAVGMLHALAAQLRKGAAL